MAKVILTPTFLSELKEIIEFITTFYDKESAINIKNQLLDSISLLENFPRSGHIICYDGDKAIYRIIKGRYNIYYNYANDYVRIISIVDSKRDLKYLN